MPEPIHILFVDDQWCEPDKQSNILAEFGSLLRDEPPYIFHYETAGSPPNKYSVEPVLQRVASIPGLSAIFLDVLFGTRDVRLGLDILDALRREYPILPIFMMTSLENELDAIERAMELGANEYLIKTPSLQTVKRLLQIYTQPAATEFDFALWGNAKPIRDMRALITRVSAGGKASVLIIGESGTGKELVARAIHRQGPRKSGPFVEKNCAGVSPELLDSDLFGHEKGSFTGATHWHIGRVERADKGILFLDEISSISHELQAKLLRVLETRQFQRVGGTETLGSDFELVCATNQNPETLVKQGVLREDFYYRIKQFDLVCPPLRDRPEDIPILAGLFLRRFRASAGASYRAQSFTDDALNTLSAYPWPGNVRELKNVVERAAILAREPEIGADCLPPELAGRKEPRTLSRDLSDAEILSGPPEEWFRVRLQAEIHMALEVKQHVQAYKGAQWKAEFMRLMYPECKAANAKGFDDLIRRLTQGPWGDPKWEQDSKLRDAIEVLRS